MLLLVVLGVAAVPAGAAGVAYACTALATLNLSTSSAVAGSTVTVTGKGFSPHDPSDVRTAPAVVRMDAVDGPALASVSPSSPAAGGGFTVDIVVPNVEPGTHVLIVTQNGVDGRPAYGTPARAVLTVEAPAPVTAAPAAPPPPPAPPAPPLASLAPVVTPPPAVSPGPRTTVAQRIAACKRKYKLSSAKTKKGRKRIAARRASCIRDARRRTT